MESGYLLAQHVIENKEYMVQHVELPAFSGKDELSEIIKSYKDKTFVTAWIEDTDTGVSLYLQRDIESFESSQTQENIS
jgi:hypothetical protein